MAETQAQKSLAFKLAGIMARLNRLPKNGYNSFHNYRYTEEADLMDALRPLLAENKIVVVPSVLGYEKDGDKKQFTRVHLRLVFIDGETGERIESEWWGEAQDSGDKGLYKAYTGAMKYAMFKTFLVSTGDDPEREEVAEEQEEKQVRVAPKASVKQPAQKQSAKADPQPAAASSAQRYVFGKVKRWAEDKGINPDEAIEASREVIRQMMQVPSCSNLSAEQWQQVAGKVGQVLSGVEKRFVAQAKAAVAGG